MEPHNFMMEEGGDVKILLQDLLSGSEASKGKKKNNTKYADYGLFSDCKEHLCSFQPNSNHIYGTFHFCFFPKHNISRLVS